MMTTTTILILKIMVGDVDGDGDCFRRIDCPGDGYDDVAGDFDDKHGDCFLIWRVICSSYLPIFCICTFTA